MERKSLQPQNTNYTVQPQPNKRQSARVFTVGQGQRLPSSTSSENKEDRKLRRTGSDVNCLGCGEKGHYKKQGSGTMESRRHSREDAEHGRVYSLCQKLRVKDNNVVNGTFLINNVYASVLFDTGTDRSFVSYAFSKYIDIHPTTLDTNYSVELADGKSLIGTDKSEITRKQSKKCAKPDTRIKRVQSRSPKRPKP
ncbi:hypothetical protein Tco_1302784 [Tanacetum coccineum]